MHPHPPRTSSSSSRTRCSTGREPATPSGSRRTSMPGVPVNLTDASGNTLLMLAAYHGHAATVTMLAGRGADVDRVNDRGQSPLAGAVFKGEDAVVTALLQAGADPDAGTPTARETAEMFGRPDLMERA